VVALNLTIPSAAENSSEISTESEFSVEDDIYEERTDYDFAKRPGSSWTARLCHIGIEEETLFKMQGVSLSTLEETWSATSIESLTKEQVLSTLEIPELTPVGLSQQFDLQRERSRITLYVQGRWLCSLLLDITAPDFDSYACTQELEIWVCTEALLERTRRNRSPQIFAETTTVTVPAHLALLPILFEIAGNPDSFMGGRLGHFSDSQCTLIASLDPVPWDTVVNPLWDKLVDFVAQDWLAVCRPHREQPLQDPLLPVNLAGGSRVTVPAPCINLQEVAVAGSLRVISATAQALEEHTLRSFTREPSQLLKDMELCR